MRPERRQVGGDSGLVVGAAAAVQPTVAFGRLERRRIPLRRITFGLDIVMGVQQYRRRTGRCGMAGDHRGRAALGDDLDVGEAGRAQQVGDRLRAAPHLVAAVRVGPHRLDAHQVLEVGAHRGQHGLHPCDEIVHLTILRERA